MKEFKPENYIYRLQAGEPVGTVKPGEIFRVHTKNGFGRDFDDTGAFERFMDGSEKAQYNHPCVGPVEVQGATADASLAIRIINITSEKALQCISKSTGLINGNGTGRHAQILDARDGFIDYGNVKVRHRPSIGVLATLDGESRSCGRCSENGGNLDFPYLSMDSTVFLPVNYQTGQIAIGDAHLRQGFGEIPGMGLECSAVTDLKVELVEKIPYPVIDTGNFLTIIGWGMSGIESQQKATSNAIDYLKRLATFKKWSDVMIYQFLANADMIPGNLTGRVCTFAVVFKKRDFLDPVNGLSVFTLPALKKHVDEENLSFEQILEEQISGYEQLPVYHDGNSREIRDIPGQHSLLISKLKPFVHSHLAKGPVEIEPKSAVLRAQISGHLCKILEDLGVKTTTLKVKNEFVLMKREDVAPIEVVVKHSLIGSPKHLYKGLADVPTLDGNVIKPGDKHRPYVRFDWRVPTPGEDATMPDALARKYIDTERAQKTALEAFEVLQGVFISHEMEILDCCFFMNKAGNVICGEVSPDNIGNIVYKGEDQQVALIMADRSKDNFTRKLECITALLGI